MGLQNRDMWKWWRERFAVAVLGTGLLFGLVGPDAAFRVGGMTLAAVGAALVYHFHHEDDY